MPLGHQPQSTSQIDSLNFSIWFVDCWRLIAEVWWIKQQTDVKSIQSTKSNGADESVIE